MVNTITTENRLVPPYKLLVLQQTLHCLYFTIKNVKAYVQMAKEILYEKVSLK